MTSSPSPAIHADNVTFGYNGATTLSEVSFLAPAGATTVILGRSGVGKSTVLRLIVGLERPDSGTITVGDSDVAALRHRDLLALRRRIGLCFQSGALLNSLTVGENVAFPLRRQGGHSRAEIAARVAEMLKRVGLGGEEQAMPAALSGGMRKRAGLARALVLDPAVLLFDEPTAGLDPILAGGIRDLVLGLKALQRTMVIVTHDLPIAFAVADHVVMLEGGRVIAQGTPDALRTDPQPFVQQFLEGRSE